MSEYINIISKEAVTAPPTWIIFVGGIVPILHILSTLVYWAVVKNPFKAAKYLGIVSSIAAIVIIWMCISCAFLSEPTGKYKYIATIDKDNMTVSEYEQFREEYDPDIKDGLYYFTAGELE